MKDDGVLHNIWIEKAPHSCEEIYQHDGNEDEGETDGDGLYTAAVVFYRQNPLPDGLHDKHEAEGRQGGGHDLAE